MVRANSSSLNIDRVLIEEYEHLGIEPFGPPPQGRPRRLTEVIDRLHTLPDGTKPMALCLSGGGIRSATFGLGVLQAFAASGRLKAFHYLSTVSGGGYIGSWLINWLRIRVWQWERVVARLADATGSPGAGHPPPAKRAAYDPVSRLRAYSNYLSPVWGMSADGLSLLATFIRNLLLNWLVWVPLLLALVTLPRLYIALLVLRPDPWVLVSAGTLAFACVVAGVACIVADLPNRSAGRNVPPIALPSNRSTRYATCSVVLLWLAAALFGLCGAWLPDANRGAALPWALGGGMLAHVLGALAGIGLRRLRGLAPRYAAERKLQVAEGSLVALGGVVGGLLLWLVLRHLAPRTDASAMQTFLYGTLAVPLVLGGLCGTVALYAGMASRFTDEDEREWWSRATGLWLRIAAIWALGFGLVVYLWPWLFDRWNVYLLSNAELVGASAALAVLTSAIGYWSENGANLRRRAKGVLDAIGLRLLDLMAAATLVALLLLASLVVGWGLEHNAATLKEEASALRQDAMLSSLPGGDRTSAARASAALAYEHVLLRAVWWRILIGCLAALAVAFLVSGLIGANTFSLHGMYGNRLVRAYLGAGRYLRRPHWFTGFDPKDNPPLTWFRQHTVAPDQRRLFQVVNIALNLVHPSSRRLAWQQRKAAPFTCTPLHCGAAALRFAPTDRYGGGEDGMTLGRALTISGAAASPNMGYHSSSLVTAVMAIFNVRLGWWLPNPGWEESHWKSSGPTVGFKAMLDEALGRTTDDQSSVHLSDGGHFENLGLYEMVRRRCHRIVVVDATFDPRFEYADLLDSLRKIRVDFGIPIELPEVLPGPGRITVHDTHTVGRIRYSARDGCSAEQDGYLYLIKPRLTEHAPAELARYALGSQREGNVFPHQKTSDQFFDETQFESYRLLGLAIAHDALPGTDWPDADPIEAMPQPASAAAGQRGALGCSGALGTTGLAGTMQHLGAGAALATAATVGGTLGVVGTIGLSSGEIKLSAEDRALLKEGFNVKLAAGELRLSAEDRSLLLEKGVLVRVDVSASAPAGANLNGVDAAVAALTAAEERLLAALKELRTVSGAAALSSSINGLRDAIVALTNRLPLRVNVDLNLKPVIDKLETVRAEIESLKNKPGAPAPTLQTVVEALGKIETQVRTLEQSVRGAAPRSNVRGQEGGAR